jgi:hypothetical protein
MARLLADKSAISVWGPLEPQQRTLLFEILPLITFLGPTKTELAPFIERVARRFPVPGPPHPSRVWVVRFFAECEWRQALQNPDSEIVMFADWMLDFDYNEYLRSSEVWKTQRARVLKKAQHLCACCGQRTRTVHHRDYRPRVMRGEDDGPLVALCGPHHDEIHATMRENGKGWNTGERRLYQLVVDRLFRPPALT